MEEICSHTCTLSSRRHVFYLSFSVFASKEKIYIDSEKENLTDLSNYIEEIS